MGYSESMNFEHLLRYEQCVRESEERCRSTVANLRMELATPRQDLGQRDGDIQVDAGKSITYAPVQPLPSAGLAVSLTNFCGLSSDGITRPAPTSQSASTDDRLTSSGPSSTDAKSLAFGLERGAQRTVPSEAL